MDAHNFSRASGGTLPGHSHRSSSTPSPLIWDFPENSCPFLDRYAEPRKGACILTRSRPGLIHPHGRCHDASRLTPAQSSPSACASRPLGDNQSIALRPSQGKTAYRPARGHPSLASHRDWRWRLSLDPLADDVQAILTHKEGQHIPAWRAQCPGLDVPPLLSLWPA
jgi:hypothetical protein